jgi:hypothetical protein
MKRFLKAAGRQVNEPDSYFHLISYAIELAMIQVANAWNRCALRVIAHARPSSPSRR